jgi:hypothetical protein
MRRITVKRQASGTGTKPVTALERAIEEYFLQALGEGEHLLHFASPGPPSRVIVHAFGQGDDGEPQREIKVIDRASEDHISLETVWAHREWRRLLRKYGWHPHQQNIADMELLVKTFSLDGDLIVDFCGNGFTTAAACMKAGGRRRFVGCDIFKEWLDVARYRLKLLANELPLP